MTPPALLSTPLCLNKVFSSVQFKVLHIMNLGSHILQEHFQLHY